MNALLEGLKALGPARLAAMAVVAVGTLGLLALLALRGPQDHMALLYGDLDLREAGQLTERLDRARIPYQLGAGGGSVLVPADTVARARLLLARDGLPSGGSIGYEIFDRGDGLTATRFQQSISELRALEGELARTIRAIDGVRAARVHLVLPKREPFARERQDAQASVMLTMAGARRLDREGVQAILNLVAAAVPGLRPQNIAVIDSRGNLLARAGEPVGPAAAAQGADELKRATETRLARAVEEMLERSVGAGHVRAEATVEMDFDQVHETQEKFDPDGQVARSTQSVTDSNRTTEAAATVSVQNNLPNADSGQNQAGSQGQRQEETTNFEIGKTVRVLVRDQPQIRRMSLAVLVDGVEEPGPDGKPVWRERNAEELGRIARLVRSATGFDEKRGDKLEVASLRFTGEGETSGPEPHGMLGLKLERADLMRLAQTGLLGMVVLLGLLLVLRPMVARLVAVPPGGLLDAPSQAALAGPAGEPALAPSPAAARLAGPGPIAGFLEDESMVSIANIEGQMRASSVRRIADLVEKHPEQTLMIVRAWMQQETA
jgi:flagellar M-ring protein FliF